MSKIILKNSDCFELLPKIPNKSIDITFTSPPYNRKRNSRFSFLQALCKN